MWTGGLAAGGTASGLLRSFNEAGVIEAADVHVATGSVRWTATTTSRSRSRWR